MKAIAMLLLIASAGAQSMPHTGVRDAYRRVAYRAALAILRSDPHRDETLLDADKAIDEVRIESSSPEEDSLIPILVHYQAALLANNETRSLLDSQSQLDMLRARESATMNSVPSKEAENLKANLADRDEMRNRELACSNAIGDMLHHKLSTDLPPCTRVVLPIEEMKTKLDVK
jgi:hypothetical protein